MPDGELPTQNDVGMAEGTSTELVVRFRYGEGVLLEGNTDPHGDVIKKAVPRWRWFRSRRQWEVNGSRYRTMTEETVQRYADGLTQAGVPVRVDYEAPNPDNVRPSLELYEEQQLRDSRVSAEPTVGSPFASNERATEPAEPSVHAHRDAEHNHARDRTSKAQATMRKSPVYAIRRLQELHIEARDLALMITGQTPPDRGGLPIKGPTTGDVLASLLTRLAEVQDGIANFTELLEAGHVLATEEAPRPTERVMTERGPAITIKTTDTMVRLKRGGRQVSVARSRVWLPRSVIALRAEEPLSKDEAYILWRAQHHGKVEWGILPQLDGLESLVDRGLLIAHPDATKAGIYLPTDRGKAFELPEGKPKTWLPRWDGLRAVPETKAEEPQTLRAGPQRGVRKGSAPRRTQGRPTAEDADRLAEQLGLTPGRMPTIEQLRETMVQAVREGLDFQMKAWFVACTRVAPADIDAALDYAREVIGLEDGEEPPDPLRDEGGGEDHIRAIIQSLEQLPEIRALLEEAGGRGAKVSEPHHERFGRPRSGEDRAPEGTTELQQQLRDAALRKLSRLRVRIDPSLYHPDSDPEAVYQALCAADSEAGRRVLEDLLGLGPSPSSDGWGDAADLGDGLETNAAERTATSVKDDADAEGITSGWLLDVLLGDAGSGGVENAAAERTATSVKDDADAEGVTSGWLLDVLLGDVGGEAVESAAAKPSESASQAAKNDAARTVPSAGRRSGSSKETRTSATTPRPKAGSVARRVRAIVSARIAEDGPKAILELSTKHEESMVRAARRMAKRGELDVLRSPRGCLWITAGPKWQLLEPTLAQESEGTSGDGPGDEAAARVDGRELAERRERCKGEPPGSSLDAPVSPPDGLTLSSCTEGAPTHEGVPLSEDFPVTSTGGPLIYRLEDAVYIAHHGPTDPEAMMGRDTARRPTPLEGYRSWLRERSPPRPRSRSKPSPRRISSPSV